MFGVEFRPLDFESVYGLDTVKDVLRGALKSQDYDPGYLLAGSYSSGKTTIGRIFARAVLCPNKSSDMSPCNQCPSCRSFIEERNPGYLEIDAANNGTKDRIQSIKETLQYESISGYKIILFDEAHRISKEGKDALLTQLERIRNNVILLFCTTEIEKMPPEIASRCLEFHFPDPTEKEIVRKLKDICEVKDLSYKDQALRMIVRSGGRHFRDAENRLRQVSLLGDITEENVKKVATTYDKEIAALLLYLSTDISKSLKVADYLVTKMDVRRLYHNILAMLNDAVKSMNGVIFLDEHYHSLLRKLEERYDKTLYEMVSHILGKNRLNDVTFFTSDLMVMHYKFKKGGFKVEGFSGRPSQSDPVSKEPSEKEKFKKETLEDENLEPWERDERVRAFKMRNIKKGPDAKVPERVSDSWGPEEKKGAFNREKAKLTPKEFERIVRGDLEPDKI